MIGPGNFSIELVWRMERAAFALILHRDNPDGSHDYIRLVPEKFTRHGVIPDDHMVWLEDHQAKQLMLAFVSEARKHGIRPPLEAEDTAAMKRHLEDMRALVFADHKAEKP